MAILQVYACIINSVIMNSIMLVLRGMVVWKVRAEKQERRVSVDSVSFGVRIKKVDINFSLH